MRPAALLTGVCLLGALAAGAAPARGARPPADPGSASASASAALSPTEVPPIAQAAWRAVRSGFERGSAPAVWLAIIDAGHVAGLFAAGATGNPAHPVADARQHLRIGSISKTFAGLLALRLAADGTLPLDTPLQRLGDPPLRGPLAARPVTVAMLLEHSAGLSDLGRAGFDSNAVLSLAQAFAVDPGSLQPRWPPGRFHSYSNVDPGLFAWAVQQATGRPYEAVLHDRLLAPLGLDSATFDRPDDLPVGHRADGRTPIPYWNTLYRAFGGLNVSLADMARLVALQARGAAALPGLDAAGLDRQRTPRTTAAARAGLDFGYGLGIYPRLHDGRIWYGHGGDADGYLSRFGVLPGSGRGYFVLIDADDPRLLGRLADAAETALAADLPEPAAAPVRPDAAPVAQVDGPCAAPLPAPEGSLRQVTWRFGDAAPARPLPPRTLHVTTRGIRIEAGGASRELVRVGTGLYAPAGAPEATDALVRIGCEGPFLQTADVAFELVPAAVGPAARAGDRAGGRPRSTPQ